MAKNKILLIIVLTLSALAMKAQTLPAAATPQFVQPGTSEALPGDTTAYMGYAVHVMNPMNVQFIWTQPMMARPGAMPPTYTLRIVEVQRQLGQSVDDALDHNPVVLQKRGLMTTMYLVPNKMVKVELKSGKLFAAQVICGRAKSAPVLFQLTVDSVNN